MSLSVFGQNAPSSLDRIAAVENYTEMFPAVGNSCPRPRSLIAQEEGSVLAPRRAQLTVTGLRAILLPYPCVRAWALYIKQTFGHNLTSGGFD